MRIHSPLGDEQSGGDLLVAQTVRNQRRHLRLPLRERAGVGAKRSSDRARIRFTESQPHRCVATQAFARLKLGLELRCPEGFCRRLSGLGLEWRVRSNDLCAGTGTDGLRCPEQPGCEARMAGARSEPTQARQNVVLGYPVVDLPCDPQGLAGSRICVCKIAIRHGDRSDVAKHRCEVKEVAGVATQTHALRDGRRGGVDVACEERMDSARLHELDGRSIVGERQQ